MTEVSPLYIVLFGAQGSGKGTQARLLQDHFGIPQVATGDLFRYHIKSATPLGVLAKGYLDRGELVPDEVTNGMVADRLEQPDAQGGAVLDGYPRNTAQAHALQAMLAARGSRVAEAIYIRASEAELMRRLTGRRICRRCQAVYHIVFNPPTVEGRCDRCGGELYQREDDKNEAALRNRLQDFADQTLPVIAWYRACKLLVEVDGQQDIQTVYETILNVVRAGQGKG